MTECEFLFAVLAEKHNTVIREIPPWNGAGKSEVKVEGEQWNWES